MIESDVFSLVCPLNDRSGEVEWSDAIEEHLNCDLDLLLSKERNGANFPQGTLDTWLNSLNTGLLWRSWVEMVKENGLDLKESSNDLLPLATLFAEIGTQTLQAAKSSLEERAI